MQSRNLRSKGLAIFSFCFFMTIVWNPIKDILARKTELKGSLPEMIANSDLRYFAFCHRTVQQKEVLPNATCFTEESKGHRHICLPFKLKEFLNLSNSIQCLSVSMEAFHLPLSGESGDRTGEYLSALLEDNNATLCCVSLGKTEPSYNLGDKHLCCQIRYFNLKMKISGVYNESGHFATKKCFIWAEMNEYSLSQANLSKEKKVTFQKRKLYAQEDEDYEGRVNSPEPRRQPLIGFRVIGCSAVAIFVGCTLIIYVTSGMYYPDCLAQICSEACLFSAYVCILLVTTDSSEVKKGMCLTVAVLLHFLFVAFFQFLLLEVVCMSRLLLGFFPKKIFPTARSILIVGWGIPILICGITAAAASDQYHGPNNCWLNLQKAAMWPTVIPLGIIIGLHVLLLLMILFVSSVPSSVDDEDYKRAESFLSTRWASAITVVMATVSWSFGIMASQSSDEMYYAAFTISSIVLGVVIFILRISTDEEVRTIMTSHFVCRFIKQKNKVSSWSEKVFRAEKVLQSEKKAKDSAWVSNEKLTTHS